MKIDVAVKIHFNIIRFENMDQNEFLKNGHEIYLPNLSLDSIIIGYENEKLKCLLLRVGDKWVLPGGYVKRNEGVDSALKRIIFERTHIENTHTRLLTVFGEANRSFRNEFEEYAAKINMNWPKDSWMNDRFVTLSYYAFMDIKKVNPKVGPIASEIKWFDFNELPNMWLDHESILKKTRQEIKTDVRTGQSGFRLLPDEFTMPQLHQLHQVVLETSLDRSRFQKTMLALDIFERLPKMKKESRGRSPYLYRLKLLEK